jgi:hypothetical protein
MDRIAMAGKLEKVVGSMASTKKIALLLATVAMAAGTQPAHAQTAPSYVVQVQNILTTSLAGPNGNLAANKNGDVFVPDAGAGVVHEYPANGGAPISIFTTSTGSQLSGVAVDFSNNLYVTTRYDGNVGTNESDIFEFPYAGGGYPTPYSYGGSAAPHCGAPGTNTSVCNYGQFYTVTGTYYQPQAIAFDAAGNGYLITTYDSYSGGGKTIYICNVQCGQNLANATILADNLPTKALSIASDAAGDIYYTDGASVYVIYAGTTTPVLFDGTLVVGGSGAQGVGFDRAGNLYVNVNQNGSPYDDGDYEYPLVNGTISASNKFLLDTMYGYTGPTVDSHGNVWTANYNQLTEYQLYNGSFPATPIATASTPLTFTVLFDAAGTIASLKAYQGSAAATEFAISADGCTGTTQGVRSTCTFNVTFTPSAVGIRRGAVVLTDSTGAQVTTYLTGTGSGTGISVDPGTAVAIGSTFTTPSGLAVDSSGNVFVADSGANTVSEFVGGSGAPVSIGTGLSSPTGVALDNLGNVFIVNQGAGTVVEVPNVNGTLTNAKQTTLLSGLKSPTDVFIDSIGELYVSNTGNNEVLQYPNPTRFASSATSSSLGNGLSGPTGIEVDLNGILYVADTGNARVVQISPTGGQANVGSGFSTPTGVTVEASGSVIVADPGNGSLVRVPNEATGLASGDQVSLSQPMASPYAVRIASTGNLYVTDNQNAVVSELNRTAGTLDFGVENLNTTSAPQSIVLSSIGTSPLTLNSPLYTPVPASSDFSVTAGTGSSACSSGTLASGYDCTLQATFEPTTSGAYNYPLVFAASANNAAAPSLDLIGQGVQLQNVTVTLQQTTTSPSYGTPVVFTVTVANAGAGTTTPTGDAVFIVDGQKTKKYPLTNGSATLTLTGLTGGSHSVQATYLGDNVYASGSSTVDTFTVSLGTVTELFTISSDAADPYSAAPGNPVGFNVVLTPSVAGTFGGTVTVTISSTISDTTTVYANANGTYGASYSTTTLAPGTYNVVATYSGNANYTGISSTAMELVIAPPSYTITASTSTITSTQNSPGSTTLTVISYSDFQGGVDFNCSGLPANAYCIFEPGTASLINEANTSPAVVPQQTINMQILVDEDPIVVKSAGLMGLLGLLSGAGLLLTFRKNRTRRRITLACALATAGAIGLGSLNGCGSGAPGFSTPAGSYNIVVSNTATPLTAASGGQQPTPTALVPNTSNTTSNPAESAAAYSDGTTVALTIPASFSYLYPAGEVVNISQVSPSGFNGNFTLLTTPTGRLANNAGPSNNNVATLSYLYFAAPASLGATTGSGGYIRIANQSAPSNTFTLVVK